MDWIAWAALFAAGLVAGAINAVAGGGSLITLPLLIFFGLPETVANATNRLGVLANSLTSAGGYQQSRQIPWPTVRLVLLPTLAGSAFGALLAARITDDAFRPVIAAVLVAMAALLVLEPRRWLQPTEGARALPPLAEAVVFFAIGVYGGFIQAGIGFFLIAATVRVAGHDLVRANGVKVVLTLTLTAVALVVFLLAGEVRWTEGLILAAGTAIGGYAGARLAVRRGASWVRWVLVGMVALSALELLGVYRAIGRLLGF